MRREFQKQIKRAALERSRGFCEGVLTNGTLCGIAVDHKRHFDHDIPDALGGEPTLENCRVLCLVCHKEKTTKLDIPAIAKTKRIADKHIGIKTTRKKIQSAGFRKSAPQRTASRPIERRT